MENRMTDKEILDIRQDTLRQRLIDAIDHYLGNSEDVHNDFIFVEPCLEVGYRSRNDNSKRDYRNKYYSVLSLIKRDGMWFKPDLEAVETIVNEYVPSPEVKDFVDKLVMSIHDYLVAEQPQSLRTHMFSIGAVNHEISCYDESTVETVEADDDDDLSWLEEDENLGNYEHFKMFGIVTRTADGGYTVDPNPLTRIALQYVK